MWCSGRQLAPWAQNFTDFIQYSGKNTKVKSLVMINWEFFCYFSSFWKSSLNGMGRPSATATASPPPPSVARLSTSLSAVSRFCGRGAINYSAVVIREKRGGERERDREPFHFLLL